MAALAGPLISRQVSTLSGEAAAPGDKSISHRALIFAGLAHGVSEISGMLEGDDVLRTAAALRAFGADIERDHTHWRVTGGPWTGPERAVYLGNSGTGVRLLMGAAAGNGISAGFDGDVSLRSRPMGRVLEPLRLMGLSADDTNGRLPVAIHQGAQLSAVTCRLARPSAQVKSAILLAALGAEGETRIHEPVLCRDHTERMLAAFGVKLSFEADGETGRFIAIEGGQNLSPVNLEIPGDPSSAAFLVAAAMVTPGSDIVVRNVLVNPLRAGFYDTLREMGGDIVFENRRDIHGEPVADIRARHSILHGVEVPADRAPSMIDEYPILSVAASYAIGETMMRGLEELRLKESDRIASVEAGLAACGVDAASGDDWLRVRGDGSPPAGGARIRTQHDHRVAMSFLALGCASKEPVEIDEGSMIATSFPAFIDEMRRLGAQIAAE